MAEHCFTRVFGQIQIQKDQIRDRRARVLIRGIHMTPRCLAVMDHLNPRVDPRQPERFKNQELIAPVVLYNQNVALPADPRLRKG